MYHPYFRGKQYELITIRETSNLLARNRFVPIVEPVKEALGGLERTLRSVSEAGGTTVVIINPYHGDHREGGTEISTLLNKRFMGDSAIGVGILLREDVTVQEAIELLARHHGHDITLVHAGFTQARALAELLSRKDVIHRNVFLEAHCGRLYRKHFAGVTRVLIRDGFQRRRNRDHPSVEHFSDLHVTYSEEGMDGFGDFLIVGDDYSESGGPAYAVAIHLTFIDPGREDAMFIYHFVSTRQDTPTDPAGKFAEALEKLIRKLDSGTSNLTETTALAEFRTLHAKGHFPGLGYVKKLAMKHHVETLAAFCR